MATHQANFLLVLFLGFNVLCGFKVMIPWAGGAGVGHLHPEHAVQAELHDLCKKLGEFRETSLRSKRFLLKSLIRNLKSYKLINITIE